jgi:hypothetical protein
MATWADSPDVGQPTRSRPRNEHRLLAGWIATDRLYDYDYAPRVEHYFNGSEYSYCGKVGVWSTNRNLVARRRCYHCTMWMVRDGLVRVVSVKRGAW